MTDSGLKHTSMKWLNAKKGRGEKIMAWVTLGGHHGKGGSCLSAVWLDGFVNIDEYLDQVLKRRVLGT